MSAITSPRGQHSMNCPKCDRLLAMPPDHDPERDADRDDLCWLRWGHNRCTGDPTAWRARALAAEADLAAVSAELDAAYAAAASLIVERAKRRAAARRIAEYCRETNATLELAVDVGIAVVAERSELADRVCRHEAGRLPQGEELIAALRRKHEEQLARRDAAIEALKRRVAELLRGGVDRMDIADGADGEHQGAES